MCACGVGSGDGPGWRSVAWQAVGQEQRKPHSLSALWLPHTPSPHSLVHTQKVSAATMALCFPHPRTHTLSHVLWPGDSCEQSTWPLPLPYCKGGLGVTTEHRGGEPAQPTGQLGGAEPGAWRVSGTGQSWKGRALGVWERFSVCVGLKGDLKVFQDAENSALV